MIVLLGASGSIGRQTLEVMRDNKMDLVGCSVGHDLELATKIITEFKPKIVCLREENALFVQKFPDVEFCYGDEGLIKLAKYPCSMFVNALMGSVGLKPTVVAINEGHDIALANKETLVMAGDIIMPLAKEKGVHVYPIDSEHSAIWQALKGEKIEDVYQLIITASGGAFRDKTREELVNVTVNDALQHPNWKMGNKITIDCATMMNKGLEVIEAHHLFGIDYDRISTVLHLESIVHSFVEFKDSSVKAQLAVSDMRIPILYALNKGERTEFNHHLVLKDMHFKELSMERFVCLKYAYMAGKMGGIAPTVLNAANEAAVSLFLEGKIAFLDIEKIIEKELMGVENYQPSIEDIIRVDAEIKGKYLGGNL